MSRHRYPRRVILADLARAGIGLALCLGVAAAAGFSGLLAWLFGVCALVFLLFGARTLIRSVTNYELTGTGLTRSYGAGFGRAERTLAWQEITKLRLRFFPAKRDRSQGWMELALAGGGTQMRLDSTLGDFDAILRVAVGAAERKRLALGESTLGNLAALGIAVSQVDGGKVMGKDAPSDSARL